MYTACARVLVLDLRSCFLSCICLLSLHLPSLSWWQWQEALLWCFPFHGTSPPSFVELTAHLLEVKGWHLGSSSDSRHAAVPTGITMPLQHQSVVALLLMQFRKAHSRDEGYLSKPCVFKVSCSSWGLLYRPAGSWLCEEHEPMFISWQYGVKFVTIFFEIILRFIKISIFIPGK